MSSTANLTSLDEIFTKVIDGTHATSAAQIIRSVWNKDTHLRCVIFATHQAGKQSRLAIRFPAAKTDGAASLNWEVARDDLLGQLSKESRKLTTVIITISFPGAPTIKVFSVPIGMFFSATTDAELKARFQELNNNNRSVMEQAAKTVKEDLKRD